jgi:hypothetical protein
MALLDKGKGVSVNVQVLSRRNSAIRNIDAYRAFRPSA